MTPTNGSTSDRDDIDLIDVILIAWSWKYAIACIVILSSLCMYFVMQANPTTYRTSMKVEQIPDFALLDLKKLTSYSLHGQSICLEDMSTASDLVTSEALLLSFIDQLNNKTRLMAALDEHLPVTNEFSTDSDTRKAKLEELASSLSVTALEQQKTMLVTFETPSPRVMERAVADAVDKIFLDVKRDASLRVAQLIDMVSRICKQRMLGLKEAIIAQENILEQTLQARLEFLRGQAEVARELGIIETNPDILPEPNNINQQSPIKIIDPKPTSVVSADFDPNYHLRGMNAINQEISQLLLVRPATIALLDTDIRSFHRELQVHDKLNLFKNLTSISEGLSITKAGFVPVRISKASIKSVSLDKTRLLWLAQFIGSLIFGVILAVMADAIQRRKRRQ